jgi:uncharacterized membrane protein YeaQ/YmgE (transglycosylase-associated protein family)
MPFMVFIFGASLAHAILLLVGFEPQFLGLALLHNVAGAVALLITQRLCGKG